MNGQRRKNANRFFLIHPAALIPVNFPRNGRAEHIPGIRYSDDYNVNAS